ncbi:MAG: dihydrolipoamide dehydrogenase [Alphaproteobacteria bacterium]|nr:dihydrolipoamide dehydrogenase [Alphaproteobacteria bacterium]
MAHTLKPDICVIGAGSGGLVVASGAALMGAAVVLVEKHRMGGDCLNFGCVPSKALIAAAARAIAWRGADAFGVDYEAPRLDFARSQRHVKQVIAAIAPNDSVERYAGMGVNVIHATARFIDPETVLAGDTLVRARRFVVATGSSPLVPPIPGLASVPFFTNETIFDNSIRPRHLIVLGGGPIGLELAQAHRRLGAEVTVLEMARFLPKDDPEVVEQVLTSLARDRVVLRAGSKVTAVARADDGIVVTIERDGRQETLHGSHLLVAAGRRANVTDLGLELAGIGHTGRGVTVDARLRTTNRRVYAVGDVVGSLQFTHMASYQAGIVLRNILFRLPAKSSERAIPWVTYTAPELASVGLQEEAARAAGHDIRVLRWPVSENERAIAERDTEGLIKVVVGKRGVVLGAQIVARNAGDLILPWILAVQARQRIAVMAGLVVPYPIVAEIGKRAAGSYFQPMLTSSRTRRIVRFLARFG